MGSFRIFNFQDNQEEVVPVPGWALKLGKKLGKLFDPNIGLQPVNNLGSDKTLTDMLGTSDTNSMTSIPTQWKVFQDRKSVYLDIEAMDGQDEVVATALDITASNATDFLDDEPSRLQFRSKDARVSKILNDLRTRLELDDSVTWQLARDMAMHGSIFREVVIDAKLMKIVDFKQTLPFQIYPKTNMKGDKQPGWLVKVEQDIYNGGGQSLDEWQICPFLFGSKRGYLTTPPLAAARRGWYRLNKMEDGMAVARLVRAYDKLVHKIPVQQQWATDDILKTIKRYKDAITKRKMENNDGSTTQLDAPLDVATDFYMPDDGTNRGDVKVLTSNNQQLGNLNDLLYSREKLLVRLKVPISSLQLTSAQKTHISKGGGGVSEAQIEFARHLRNIQAVIRRGYYRLGDMELLLNGIIPTVGLYEVVLRDIDTADPASDAQILLTCAQAAVYFVEAFGALPTELLASKFLSLTPDQQIMMDKFLTADGDKITELRMKALAEEAAPGARPIPPAAAGGSTGKGSGNSNKSRAARSSEQKGGSKAAQQGEIPLEDLVSVFAALQQNINSDLTNAGVEFVPDVDESFKNLIRQNLRDIATVGELDITED
jgi:hypothetical protein